EGTYSCQQRAIDGVVGPSRRSEHTLRHDDRIGEFPSMYHRAATRGTTHDIEPSARDPFAIIPASGRLIPAERQTVWHPPIETQHRFGAIAHRIHQRFIERHVPGA